MNQIKWSLHLSYKDGPLLTRGYCVWARIGKRSKVDMNGSLRAHRALRTSVCAVISMDQWVPQQIHIWSATSLDNGNGNDDDRSFSQLPVHKALTCPAGQSAWAVPPSLFGEGNSLNAQK